MNETLGAEKVGRSTSPWTQVSLDDPLFLTSKVGSLGVKRLSEALQGLSLKPRHLAALRFIAANGGVLQRDLIAGLWSDSSSVVTLLDDFGARGLAERRPHPSDRRAHSVWLTDLGQQTLNEAMKISDQVCDDLLAPLSDEEKQHFSRYLRRIVEGRDSE